MLQYSGNQLPRDLYDHTAGTYYRQHASGHAAASTILLSDASTAKLQVSQLIFSGQYIVGIQTAKLARIISEQNLEFNELDIKEAVITSYYLVLITEESLDILEQNVENLRETMEQTETMFNTGMAEQTDVDQISITVNQLENSLNALERNLELNYNMFRFQLGLEPNVQVTLTDNLEALFVTCSTRITACSALYHGRQCDLPDHEDPGGDQRETAGHGEMELCPYPGRFL